MLKLEENIITYIKVVRKNQNKKKQTSNYTSEESKVQQD